jgi:hypothetical protein
MAESASTLVTSRTLSRSTHSLAARLEALEVVLKGRKAGLHRMYDRLEADERFRLDVLATARGDTQESECLMRTCPRFNYTMNDCAYVGRWTGTYEITLRMYIALNNTMTKLQMVDAFRELIPYSGTLMHNATFDAYFDGHRSGSYHSWNHAGKTGHPPA